MQVKSVKQQANTGLVALLLLVTQVASAAELSTLFTTPEERQIINSNRYKSDEIKQKQLVVVEEPIEGPIQARFQEEVIREYKISGITISRDGSRTVWINSQAYEDGAALDNNSKIRVMMNGDIRVRITAPDGKHYYAASGETIEITFLAPVEN
ncbi:MAG: hypothetical protein OES20_00450 [Gammaproteobacteria bacterium]|nr:hypothetical protein [Gammaproteobacteria bacterium]